MATHTDDQVGRVIDTLTERGVLDSTIVLYILGENGASAEAGAYGTFNEMAYQNNVLMTTADIGPHLDEVGGPKSFNHIPAGWAQAMNTPYQWSKIVASHWGGTRTGMIARYPSLTPAGERRNQFTHVIDIVPTLLEVAGLPMPQQVNGVEQRPLEGNSFVYAMTDPDAPNGTAPSTSRSPATAASTTTAGPRSPSTCCPGRTRPGSSLHWTTTGGSCTAPTTGRRPTTSPPSTPTNCTSCSSAS